MRKWDAEMYKPRKEVTDFSFDFKEDTPKQENVLVILIV